MSCLLNDGEGQALKIVGLPPPSLFLSMITADNDKINKR